MDTINTINVSVSEITNADYESLRETACVLIEKYVFVNMIQYMQPGFHTMMCKDVSDLLKYTVKDAFECDSLIDKSVEAGLALFYKHILPARSSGPTFIRIKPNINKMTAKIKYLQSVPQPEQRTPEWYLFRYKHLTASNIWKTFVSESTKNQLIFEKCQPLNADKSTYVNMDSPMHWGQKYEPLSIKLYEQLYKTKVSDFGCIPHKNVEFLAASPDGINTLESSWRYGRMLEVKNIVNREINGIPKLEYWVQMQLQLEVCDLNECDFLETRFTEYPDVEAYNACPSRQKGMMMLFMKSNGQPLYELGALPASTASPAPPPAMDGNLAGTASTEPSRPPTPEGGVWACCAGGGTPQEEIMEKHKDLTWIKNIYWKLDQLSCVLVLRNKAWFASALPQLKELWQTIEREKKTGYAHRAPKKNVNKSNSSSATVTVKKMGADTSNIEMPNKCFITIET
jgi:putative phage-type endonuclease